MKWSGAQTGGAKGCRRHGAGSLCAPPTAPLRDYFMGCRKELLSLLPQGGAQQVTCGIPVLVRVSRSAVCSWPPDHLSP